MRRVAGLLAVGLLSLAAWAQQADPVAAEPHGKVLFSRSVDENAKVKPWKANRAVSTITDADRAAVTFTRYAIDARLRPAEHAMDVRAQLTVRNDGDHPLTQLPLQLSSTLNWEQIRVGASAALFAESTIASDADHTGQLHEAAVVLATPLAPAASLELDVIYSGAIAADAQRLVQIGTPLVVAQKSDWDEIAEEFTGLRGFGNVAWYPVSSVPVKLGDGDKLFAAVGMAKQRQQNASVAISLTAEVNGPLPTVAILNGTVVPLMTTPGDAKEHLPAIVKAELPAGPLRFQTMSLFLANRQKRSGNALDVYARPEDEAAIQPYLAAGSMVTPLLRSWLQAPSDDRPKAMLAVLDLAAIDDAPFEERQTLFTGLQPATADQLTAPMSHALAHAYFESPRPWLNEGVAHFMASLWTEQLHDRDVALRQLEDQRAALALAEPSGDAGQAGQPGLIANPNAIFYRAKATYVLWMLRSMVGDTALGNALKLYDPAKDTTDNYFERLLERASVAQPEARDLHEFFEEWVYTDAGLPELTIAGVFPSQASSPGAYIVAVDVQNAGGAGAHVPVTVSSVNAQVTERVFIPAHGHATRRLLIQGEPTQVEVNDGIVPETSASVHVQQIHYTGAKP